MLLPLPQFQLPRPTHLDQSSTQDFAQTYPSAYEQTRTEVNFEYNGIWEPIDTLPIRKDNGTGKHVNNLSIRGNTSTLEHHAIEPTFHWGDPNVLTFDAAQDCLFALT